MATSKAVRADDVSGLNIGTVSFTEDAVTKDFQRVVINNSSDGTMATVNATGLRVDASGAAVPVTVAATLNVKPSDGTNPITKTFDLDSGAGTEYNIGVGLRKIASGGSVEAGTATDPFRTDPVGTTAQPITASSLPLPTGAATDASVTGLQVAQGSSTSGQKGPVVQGAVTTNAPSYTTAQTDPLSLDTSGLLRVSLKDTPANTNKFLVTPDSVALPANQSVNVNQLAGTTADTNSGTKSAGTLRVVLATDQPALTNKLLVTADPITFASAQAVTQSGAWSVGSSTATGSAVPANAFYSGAIAKTALPTAASDGNLTGAMVDKFGRQVCLLASIRDLTGTQTTTISASTSETTIVTAGAAGIFNDLVMLIVSNTSASTNTRIDFRDTTGGSALFSLFSIGGAAPVGFALPIPIPQTSTATNWTAQCATSTTDVRIYAVFVKNK